MGPSCVEVLVPTSTSDTGRRPMIQSNKSISPLRQRMIEDMSLRKLSVKTQTAYIRAVVKLTRFLGRSPDTATAEDLRLFQLDMSETGVSSITMNATITGLRFLFEVTLDNPEVMNKMRAVHVPRKLPVVLRSEEVTRLLDAAANPKYRAALAVAYGAGLRASEVTHLTVNDIDSLYFVVCKRQRHRMSCTSSRAIQTTICHASHCRESACLPCIDSIGSGYCCSHSRAEELRSRSNVQIPIERAATPRFPPLGLI